MKQSIERKHSARIAALALLLTMLTWLVPMNVGVAKAATGDVVKIPVTGGHLLFDKETGTITGYEGKITEVVIPETFEGVEVTTIGENCYFSDCSSLSSVSIPDSVTTIAWCAFADCSGLSSITVDESNGQYSGERGVLFNKEKTELIQYPAGKKETFYDIPGSVTTIGNSAFSGCGGLSSVSIPDSVTTIGGNAFEDCSGLSSVSIPGSVTEIVIGNSAFRGCSGLSSITVDESNGQYSSDEHGVLFNKDKTELIRYPVGKKETFYDIPDGVTTIGGYAFADCSGLSGVSIPGSVTTIEWYAFADCSGLSGVSIPSSVTTIESSAFAGCSGLSSVSIPDGVTKIEYEAFADCSGLSSVSIPGSVAAIGDEAFRGCSGLSSITVDESNGQYSSDEHGVLFNKDKTELIQYPVGKKEAFYDIPDGVTTIGYFAFEGCSGVSSVSIPGSVTKIGNSAFWDCSGLSSITVDESNGQYSSDEHGVLFNKDMTKLIQYPVGKKETFYDIPGSVTKIGYCAFSGCSGVGSVSIPGSVTTIEERAFSGCGGVSSVNISDGVTTIGNSAFWDCSGLSSVTIPDSVTSIGEKAFGYAWDDDNYESIKISGFKIYGHSNDSAAAKYAKANGFDYAIVGTQPGGSDNDNKEDKPAGDNEQSNNGNDRVNPPSPPTKDQSATEPTGVKVGSAAQDKKSNGLYVVTKIQKNGGAVAYRKPVNKKKSSVTIPATVRIEGKTYKVTTVEKNAFKGNKNLKSVKIGSNIETIGANAFNKCAKLKTVKLPSKVKNIQKGAFAGCKNLKTITIQTKKLTKKTVGAGAFKGVSTKATVKAPKGKVKTYQKLLRSKGLSKKAKVK